MAHDGDDDDPADRRTDGSVYANWFEVGHNAWEFKVNCAHEHRANEGVTLYFRVVASPLNARELFRLLGLHLLQYADRFGPIDDNGGPPPRGDA